MPQRKPVQLRYFKLGNGTTVCDISRQEHGDYKKVAHISEDGKTISWYDKGLPGACVTEILSTAKLEATAYLKSRCLFRFTLKTKSGDGPVVPYTALSLMGIMRSREMYRDLNHIPASDIAEINVREDLTGLSVGTINAEGTFCPIGGNDHFSESDLELKAYDYLAARHPQSITV